MKENSANSLKSTEITDPVCGMKVTAASKFKLHHENIDYRFCCDGCAQKFSANPARYLNKNEPVVEAEPVPGALYICPMDPEIEQDHPGSCPICGMALEVAGAPV